MNQETHGAVKLKQMEEEHDLSRDGITIKAKGNSEYNCIGWILPGGTITSDRKHAIYVLNNLINRVKK
jgi:hypothetical protein